MGSFSLKRFHLMVFRLLVVFSVATVLSSVLVYGFEISLPAAQHIHYIQFLTVVLYLIWMLLRLKDDRWRIRRHLVDSVLAIVVLFTLVPLPASSGLVSIRIVFTLLAKYLRIFGSSFLIGTFKLNPARILLISFLAVILVGTILLMLPAATIDHRGASPVDALFTATSATCVTGLIVRDTGSYFSPFGQLVILVLIQIGGLGIMTFSTLFAIILGRRIGLKEEENLRNILDQSSRVDMSRLILRIVRITLFFELIGGLVLFIRFIPAHGVREGGYLAIFHAISAFCNAGFSLWADSLTAYVGDFTVNMVMMILIVAGGLGFIVMNDLVQNCRCGNPLSIRWRNLTVHSKLVLVTTVVLLGAGMLTVFYFEFDNAMLHLSTGDKMLAALFQSVTFRTAGFNTIDFADCRLVTLFIAMVLMFIGASPSSTGGGIKTTTFAVLVLSIKSLFQARDKVEIYHRTIPAQTVLRSIAILLFSLSFLVVFCAMLLATQTGRFIDIIFEATSAMGTVGLSTGMTGELNTVGKLLVTLLMYAGRIGPLTVALAVSEVRKVNVAYPETKIGVG